MGVTFPYPFVVGGNAMARRGGPVVPLGDGTPLSLTLSGNEITDAVRAAGVSGDGLSPEGSMGVWEATTNLCTNGGFETNTTGWTPASGNTIERSLAQAKFGVASLKCTYGNGVGGDANLGAAAVTLTNAPHTASAWVYVPSDYDGTGLVFKSEGYGTDGSVAVSLALRDQWQRVSFTWTPGADVTGSVMLRDSGTRPSNGRFVYLDGVQVELQPLATPYVETNGGTAARAAALVQAPAAVLDETQGWVAVRLRVPYATSGGPGYGARFMSWVTGTPRIEVYWQGGSGTIVRRGTGADAYDVVMRTWAAGDVITLIGKWDATTLYQSFNGAAFNAGTASAVIPTITDTVKIGGQASPGVEGDVDFFWFACGLGTLSNADAATIHAWGNSDPPPGLFPTAADLTLIWRAIDSTARTY